MAKSIEIPHAEASRRIGPIVLVALIAGVIVLQQVGRSLGEHRVAQPTDRMLHSQEIHDPGIAPLTLESKAAVRIARLHATEPAEPDESEADHADTLRDLDQAAQTPADRVRVAIVAGELLSKDEAVRRLKAVADQVEPGSALALDVYWFEHIYNAKAGEDFPSDARAALIDRHGWFAQLALAHGLPDSDPLRSPVVGGGMRLVTVSLVTTVGIALLALAALILLVSVALTIRAGGWQCDLETTELPGWVYLEMFNISMAWFTLLVALQIVTLFVTGPASVAGLATGELMLWLMPLCLLWPRIRGLDWEDVRADLGLHLGAGIGTEIKAGVIGFTASLPLVFLAHWAGNKAEGALSGETAGGGGFSPFESPLSHSWIPLVLGSMAAVCWAPLVEEILFRGALYRSIRVRLGRWGAIPITAMLFGAIHPYSLSGLIGVAGAGMVFGLLREWRGSLVAPMTAHFLNNALLTGLQIAYVLAVD